MDEDYTEQHSLCNEMFCPYKERIEEARDIPPSLRTGPESVQEFWLKVAPRRPASDLAYPSLTWDAFAKGIRAECAGLFPGNSLGKFPGGNSFREIRSH